MGSKKEKLSYGSYPVCRYIKPRRPQLNGKVEQLHPKDNKEFYQLLDYPDDLDLSGHLLSILNNLM